MMPKKIYDLSEGQKELLASALSVIVTLSMLFIVLSVLCDSMEGV